MKKYYSALLFIPLIVATLTGCAGDGGSSAKKVPLDTAVEGTTINIPAPKTPALPPSPQGTSEDDFISKSEDYGQKIFLSELASKDLKESVRTDVLPALTRMTDKQFELNEIETPDRVSDKGIYLFKLDSPFFVENAPQEVKAKASALRTIDSNEAFFISSEDKGKLWIVGKRDSAMRHGVYYYLEKLGVRWYLPNENWTIVPDRKDIALQIQEIKTPAFKTFDYGFSGGFGGVLPVKDYEIAPTSWNAWLQRNRFPIEDRFGGHNSFTYGEQEKLRRDPLNMAEVDGVRQKIPPSSPPPADMKYSMVYHGQVDCNDRQRTLIPFDRRDTATVNLNCPADAGRYAVVSYIDESGRQFCEDPCDYQSDDGVIKLFTEWVIKSFNSRIRRVPHAYTFGIDPPDGLKFDNSWKSKNLLRHGPYKLQTQEEATDSDTTFHISNIAAREVRDRLDKNYYVNLYAYNTHALVPSIPIEKNIIVQLAPYAFHFFHTKMEPEELISAWKEKQKNNKYGRFPLGIYDYWGSPISVHDLPFLGVEKAAEKIKYFYEQNLTEVFIGESSPASGPLGLTWYVSSKMAWDPYLNKDDLLEEFYEQAFGQAKEPMKRFFERINDRDFRLSGHELAMLYRDLQEASAIAEGNAQQRVSDFEKYLHYMRLRLEYDSLKRNTPEKLAKAEELTLFTWRIYDSLMVHSYRDNFLIYLDQRGPFPQFATKWDWRTGPDTEGFLLVEKSGPVTTGELGLLMQDGRSIYAPLEFQEKTFSDNLVPYVGGGVGILGQGGVPFYSAKNEFKFVKKDPGSSLFIRTSGSPTLPDILIVLEDEAGVEMRREFVPMQNRHEIRTQSLPPGTYNLKVVPYSASITYWFEVPVDTPFVATGNIHIAGASANRKNYIFVPKNTEKIVLFADTPVAPKFYAPPNYREVPAQKNGFNLYYVDVETTADQIWAMSEAVSARNKRFHFFTIPNVFSPSPEQMMVPAELIK